MLKTLFSGFQFIIKSVLLKKIKSPRNQILSQFSFFVLFLFIHFDVQQHYFSDIYADISVSNRYI